MNKVELERQTTAIETVLSLIDKKKVNQCNPTNPPVNNKPKICLPLISLFFLTKKPIKKSDMKEMAMR